MPRPERSKVKALRQAVLRYGIAVVAVGIAVGLKLLLDPSFTWKAPFVFLVLAITVSALAGGLGCGLLATALSLLAGDYLFEAPRFTLVIDNAADAVNLAIFGLAGATISIVCARLRSALAVSVRERARLQLISDTAPQILWTATPDGVFDFLNARWFEYAGIDRAMPCPGGWFPYLHPEDRAAMRSYWDDLRTSSKAWNTQFRLRRHDGVYHSFETRAVAQSGPDGRLEKWIGSTTDVQEARELEEAVHAEAERFRRIVATAPGAICQFQLRPDGIATMPFVSPGVRDIYGLEDTEIAVDVTQIYGRIHSDDLDRFKATLLDSAAKLTVWLEEYRVLHPVKGELWIEGHASPTRAADGTVTWYGFLSDITSKKRAEEMQRQRTQMEMELLRTTAVARKHELEYRGIVENMNEGLAYCQVIYEDGIAQDYVYVSVNKAFVSLTGLSDVEGRRMSEAFPGGMRIEPEILELYGRVAQSGVPEKMEAFVRRMNQWLALSAYSPERGHFVVIFDVITQRKKAEFAARQWQRAFEQSATGIALTNPSSGLIDAVNPVTARMLGYSAEELAGRQADSFSPKSERAHLRAEVRNADEGSGHVLFESWLMRKDNTQFPALLDVTTVRDEAGAVISHVTIIHDLTEIRNAEVALRESEQTIRALLDSASQAIVAVNRSGRIVLRNAMAGSMFGYTPDELLGQQIDMLVPTEAKDRHSGHFADFFEATRTRPMGRGLELMGRRKDGSRFPVEVSLSSIEIATGSLAVAFVSDISYRKQIEQAAQSRAEQVRALAARLLTVQEDERRRVSRELHDRVCQQLASLAIGIGGMVAEEQSLDGVRTHLKELQERVVAVSEETRHIAYELHSSVLDDLGLFASLRDLCRQFAARMEDVDIEFIGDPLHISIPREIASCVYKIAQESLQNALNHARPERISVSLSVESGVISLNVTDDGVGFDLEEVKGRGRLGLISMEERARLVNGRLSIDTRPGKGTRVTLEAPLLEIP